MIFAFQSIGKGYKKNSIPKVLALGVLEPPCLYVRDGNARPQILVKSITEEYMGFFD